MRSSGTVTVVTDSAASLPPDAVASLGIVVVPMTLVIGGMSIADGTIEPEELASRAAGGRVTTSGPSPGDFLKQMEAGSSGGVLVATVSAAMSSTFEAARTAAGYLPPGSATVVDTGTAAGAEGLVVLAAARAAGAGCPLAEVAATAQRVASRVRLLATLERLDHLSRSGRVPGLAAWAGAALGVRPVFEFLHGQARPRRPAFGRVQAFQRMVAACQRGRTPGAVLHASVLHAEAPEAAATLASMLERAVGPLGGWRIEGGAHEVFTAPFSSVMVAHTGPDLVGLAWWWDPGIPC